MSESRSIFAAKPASAPAARRWLALVPTAALGLVVLAACGGEPPVEGQVTRIPDAANAPKIEATPEVAQETGGGEIAAGNEFTVESHDIYFEPKELTIPADTDVKLLLPNLGAAPHNFAIDALNISVDQAPGENKETVVNAPAGEYEYYCNVPGHKEAGMVGKLTVSADMVAAAPAAPAEGEAAAAASPAAEMAAAPAEGDAAAPAAAAQEFTVTSHDIYFEPKELTIPAGQDVKLLLPNAGAAPHNFSIDALGISVDQAPGENKDTMVNAAAGTYDFYCNVPGHKEAGMVGVLTAQ